MRTHLPMLQPPAYSAARRLAVDAPMMVAPIDPWVTPNDWLVYGHLHLILSLPTLTLLAVSPPLQTARPLQKQAAYAFIGFIVLVGVVQSYIWDSCT